MQSNEREQRTYDGEEDDEEFSYRRMFSRVQQEEVEADHRDRSATTSGSSKK